MITLRRPYTTETPDDYLFEASEYVTQFNECDDGPASVLYSEETVDLALQSGKIIADQALWLHDHQMSWHINVER
jgi:hypothetical protein